MSWALDRRCHDHEHTHIMADFVSECFPRDTRPKGGGIHVFTSVGGGKKRSQSPSRATALFGDNACYKVGFFIRPPITNRLITCDVVDGVIQTLITGE